MTYIALARKWRPRTFSDLLGQDSVRKILINSLEQQRIHHAYLFTGTRGVGKTSVARLFAKSLNCELRISATPCLQCNNCIAIEQGQFMDLVEVDGASRTRIEDTRDLLENIQYVPTTGRFKIYLIDEVHMLSNHSFNALLKTLEEPPEHVKFLLATTDPQKLPVTVLSRCLQFNLKHLPADTIDMHLQSIMTAEQINYESDALTLIAKAARGSVRDALSLLDQAIAGCDNKMTALQVKNLLGYSQQDYALQIIHALAKLNSHALLVISSKINSEGGQFKYVLNELIQYFHQISIYQNIQDTHAFISNPELISIVANQFSSEDVQLFYQIAIKSLDDLHLAPTPSIAFDMMLLRMYAFRPETPPIRPPLAFETEKSIKMETTEVPTSPPALIIRKANGAIDSMIERSNSPLISDHQQELTNASWSTILTQLNLTGLALSAAENAAFLEKVPNQVTLEINKGHTSLFNPMIVKRLEDALTKYYLEPIKLNIKSMDSLIPTPAKDKQSAITESHLRAEDALEKDPVFQQLNQEFSAELIKNSITPLKDSL